MGPDRSPTQPGLKGQTDNKSFPPLAPEREGFPDRKLTSSNPPSSDPSSWQSWLKEPQHRTAAGTGDTEEEVSVQEEGSHAPRASESALDRNWGERVP